MHTAYTDGHIYTHTHTRQVSERHGLSQCQITYNCGGSGGKTKKEGVYSSRVSELLVQMEYGTRREGVKRRRAFDWYHLWKCPIRCRDHGEASVRPYLYMGHIYRNSNTKAKREEGSIGPTLSLYGGHTGRTCSFRWHSGLSWSTSSCGGAPTVTTVYLNWTWNSNLLHSHTNTH